MIQPDENVKHKVQNTAKHVTISSEKTSIDERLFVQFIIAPGRIKTSSRTAEDNIYHFEIV